VRLSRASVSDAQLREMPGTDWYVAELYTAPVRFGRWDMLLAEAPPAPGSKSLAGGYLYATSVALAAKNRSGPSLVSCRLSRLRDAVLKRVLPRRSFAQRGGRPLFPSARQRSEAASLPFVTGSLRSKLIIAFQTAPNRLSPTELKPLPRSASLARPHPSMLSTPLDSWD
jgi:hypothetical protein